MLEICLCGTGFGYLTRGGGEGLIKGRAAGRVILAEGEVIGN